MTDKESLLRKLSAANFAAVEVQLFLDTHPNNATALEMLRKYKATQAALTAEFTRLYGPLSPSDIFGDTSFEWVNGPWPWEPSFDEVRN